MLATSLSSIISSSLFWAGPAFVNTSLRGEIKKTRFLWPEGQKLFFICRGSSFIIPPEPSTVAQQRRLGWKVPHTQHSFHRTQLWKKVLREKKSFSDQQQLFSETFFTIRRSQDRFLLPLNEEESVGEGKIDCSLLFPLYTYLKHMRRRDFSCCYSSHAQRLPAAPSPV